jgi:hypothetical protein
MTDHKYQLVLQLPGTTQEDFDVLVALEDAVAHALKNTLHDVEGHDFGSGTGNIFIDTNDPPSAFALVKESISITDYSMLKVAYRSFDEDNYHLIWPENSTEYFDLI